jgi:exosortase
MATIASAEDSDAALPRASLVAAAVLAAGALFFAVPTMIFVIRESWSGEQGAHGPIVLFTGLWLLWREWPGVRPFFERPPLSRVFALLLVFVPLYMLARVTQIVELEGYLMYAGILTVLYSLIGGSALLRLWFPLIYLAFIFPPPETLVAAVTNPLKMELSRISVALLSAAGYPISSEGVRIYIGQYELLVAAACSGLNSIISLTAISLFYIYLRHKAEWKYFGLLLLFIIPVAVLSNLVRVIILILLTYHAGEAAAQGFLHDFAGIFMFAVALAMMFAVDELIRPIWHRVRDARGE